MKDRIFVLFGIVVLTVLMLFFVWLFTEAETMAIVMLLCVMVIWHIQANYQV